MLNYVEIMTHAGGDTRSWLMSRYSDLLSDLQCRNGDFGPEKRTPAVTFERLNKKIQMKRLKLCRRRLHNVIFNSACFISALLSSVTGRLSLFQMINADLAFLSAPHCEDLLLVIILHLHFATVL